MQAFVGGSGPRAALARGHNPLALAAARGICAGALPMPAACACARRSYKAPIPTPYGWTGGPSGLRDRQRETS